MIPSHSETLLLNGVRGDLAHERIVPALYAPATRGALNVPVIGGSSLHADQFLAIVRARAGDLHAVGSSTSIFSRIRKE